MIDTTVSRLAAYALRKGLIQECDRQWAINTILDTLKIDSYTETDPGDEDYPLADLLDELLDDAYERRVLK